MRCVSVSNARALCSEMCQSHGRLVRARWGAARGAQTAVVMAPGTGLGGGIICHGKIVRGKHGFAGEIGSTMNTLDALDGNLESVAAGSGIEARYYAACGVHQTGAEISHRAQLGEDIARQTIENAGRALGLALAGGRISLIPISLWFLGPLRRLAPFGATRWCRHSRSAPRAFSPICPLSMHRSAIMRRSLELRKICWIL